MGVEDGQTIPLKASIFPSVKWGWSCGLYSPGSVTWIRQWVLSSDDRSLEGVREVSRKRSQGLLWRRDPNSALTRAAHRGFFFFFNARVPHQTDRMNKLRKKKDGII